MGSGPDHAAGRFCGRPCSRSGPSAATRSVTGRRPTVGTPGRSNNTTSISATWSCSGPTRSRISRSRAKRLAVMKYGRPEMNLKFAELCAKYDLDHWVWVPVDFLLPNPQKVGRSSSNSRRTFTSRASGSTPSLFRGATRATTSCQGSACPTSRKWPPCCGKYHPQAKVWISLQRPHPGDADAFFAYLANQAAELVRRRGDGAQRPVDGTVPPPAPAAVQAPLVSGHHAHRSLPVPDPVARSGLGRDASVASRSVRGPSTSPPFTTTTTGSPTDLFLIPTAFTTTSTRTCGRSLPGSRTARCGKSLPNMRGSFSARTSPKRGPTRSSLWKPNLRGSIAVNGSIDGTLWQWQEIEQKLRGHADQLAVRHALVPRVLRRLHAASPALRDRTGKARPEKVGRGRAHRRPRRP